MTQRPSAEPTLTERGDETHPAFAMIRAARISSTPGAVLFDSDIRHGSTVRITVETATRKRDLNSDYIHGNRQLIEVELSEAQWASFVSSMNTSGVPATLRWTREDGPVPELPFAPRLALSMAEVRGAADRMMDKIKAARDDYEQALTEKAGAKVIKEKMRALHYAIENSEPNVAFAAKMLAEHTENVVQKARADVEAMVLQKAAALGLTADQAQHLLELPAMPGEEPVAIEG